MKHNSTDLILISCSCVICQAEVTSSSLSKHLHFNHQYIYPKSPKTYEPCLECNKLIRGYAKKQFCNSSCSAKYTNARKDYTKIRTGPLPGYKPVTTRAPYTKVSQCIQCNKWTKGHRKTCSQECFSKLFSDRAKANPALGGNKNNRAHGWYESLYAGKVWLESSYELKVAQELDSNNIKWHRPKYLPYYNDKKYYADFYLDEYDVYLDPKNDYLIGQDAVKIKAVQEYNNVRVIVLNKKQLLWSSIKEVINGN